MLGGERGGGGYPSTNTTTQHGSSSSTPVSEKHAGTSIRKVHAHETPVLTTSLSTLLHSECFHCSRPRHEKHLSRHMKTLKNGKSFTHTSNHTPALCPAPLAPPLHPRPRSPVPQTACSRELPARARPSTPVSRPRARPAPAFPSCQTR